MRWMVTGPEIARVIGEFQESIENIKQKQSQGPDLKYHKQVKSVQATFTKQVNSLCHTMEKMGSPIVEETGHMLVLDTRYIVGEQVVSTVTQHIIRLERSNTINSQKSALTCEPTLL